MIEEKIHYLVTAKASLFNRAKQEIKMMKKKVDEGIIQIKKSFIKTIPTPLT